MVSEELAGLARARLVLLKIVPTLTSMSAEEAASGRLAPRTTRWLLDLAAEEAALSLQEEVNRLIERDILASGRVGRGAAAAVVVEVAREFNADVVVLAARGLAGLSAFWADAITRKVAAAYPCDAVARALRKSLTPTFLTSLFRLMTSDFSFSHPRSHTKKSFCTLTSRFQPPDSRLLTPDS